MSAERPIPVCYRHPDRETRLGCSSCGRPVCVECVRSASVGQLCPDCVAQRGNQQVITAEQVRAQASGVARVSMSLLGICVALFAAGFLIPGLSDTLFAFGAQFNRVVAAGEWWRALTAGFLHADIAHIMFNMLALYILGPHLEREVGSAAFASLYLASLLAGGAAFFLLNPDGVAVGASGAIFGLFGAWLAIAFRNRHTAWGRSGFNQLLVLLGINLALPLFIPRIAWEAHLGGLVAGVVIATVWTLPALRGRGRSARRAAVGLAIAAATLPLLLL